MIAVITPNSRTFETFLKICSSVDRGKVHRVMKVEDTVGMYFDDILRLGFEQEYPIDSRTKLYEACLARLR